MIKEGSATCPYCRATVFMTRALLSDALHVLEIQNNEGRVGLKSYFGVCPNGACRQPTVMVELCTVKAAGQIWISDKTVRSWKLLPASSAANFPPYVPAPIREDYEEACAIVALSPKASATLARRCLQGILRDYWKVNPGSLFNEIKQLQDKVDVTTWAAIDAIRKLGNIGAHMESDIDVIVAVDPGEAEALIRLIESLVEEWYVGQHEREQRMQRVILAASSKKPSGAAGTSAP